MNVYLDQIQSVRNVTAPMFRWLFNEIEPDRPMTDDEMWTWILTGKGPVREYDPPTTRVDILHGYSVPEKMTGPFE